MAKYRTTPPTLEGRYRAVCDVQSINTTNWIDVESSMFTSIASGQPLPAGLTFSSMTIVAASGNPVYLKYRAADDASSDSTNINSGVLPVVTSFFDNPINLHEGPCKVISIKKTNADDLVFFIAGFDL